MTTDNTHEKPAQQSSNALAQSDQQRQIAEVQAALMIARANRRNPIEALDRIINACTRPGLANAAIYTYARGGTDITGPSIRLAEAMAQAWGNMQFGIREIEQRNGESTVQAYAWDVETNTRREVTFQVQHVRRARNENKALTDPRDIYEMVANNGARRLRACILAIIPGDVTEAALNQCEVTMKAAADTTPEAIKKLLDAFTAIGITKAQIEKRIQRHIDAIQPAQIVGLRKIFASLKDGMSVVGDWFEIDDSQPKDKPKDKPAMDEVLFGESLPGWQKQIATGKKTPAQIIAFIGSKYTLTEAQKKAIASGQGGGAPQGESGGGTMTEDERQAWLAENQNI